MLCWICGNPANSGEHRAKASDLKMLFPEISQRSPIYTKNRQGKIISIGSLKSDKLKWDAKICHECNTSRTQRYDLAWQKLSAYLQKESKLPKEQRPKEKIRLKNVFPGSINSSMLDVHLFFVKMFGCIIAEHNIPIELRSFSQAIVSRTPHPHVLLGFGILPSWTQNKAFITPVYPHHVGSAIEFACWYYMLRKVFVDVVYSLPFYRPVATDTWHPRMNAKILRLSQLRTNQQVRRNYAMRTHNN
jgi:hypothetical protein